jgi:hypothetical protein
MGEELLDAHVIVGSEEGLDDQLSLVRGAETFFEHVRLQHRPKMVELSRRAVELLSHVPFP